MNKVVKQIWQICQDRNLQITPHYIPSLENPADGPSREDLHPLVYSTLHPQVMEFIQSIFSQKNTGYTAQPFHPKWDWMATAENAVCPQWVGEKENLFTQNLEEISPGWLNPPHHLIPRILNYWVEFPNKARALCVVPLKPQAPWWPLWAKMKVGKELVLYNHQRLFVGPEGQPLTGRQVPLAVAVLQGLDYSSKRAKSQ